MKNIAIPISILLIILYFSFLYAGFASMAPEGFNFLGITFDSPLLPFSGAAVALIAFLVFLCKSRSEKGKLLLPALAILAVAAISVALWFHVDFHRFERFSWERPNVIIIDVDTLRADHVGAYGYGLAKTPALDSLAAEGWLFENAYSHIPITMPSHSGLFTSKLPSEAKVFNNRDDLPDGDVTLAEILKENGYQTGGFISLGVLKSNFKINRGFETYDDSLPQNGQWFNTADVITDRGINWLKELDAKKPFFMWLHYSDPHEPYCAPGKEDDTEIYLNGEKVASGSLDSAKRIASKITLKPGLNTVELRQVGDDAIKGRYLSQLYFSDIDSKDLPEDWRNRLRDSTTRRKLYRDLQNEVFMNGFPSFTLAGMKISEGAGWHSPDRSSNLSRRSLHSNAVIRIENTSKQPQETTLNIKGGVYKELEAVRRDYRQEVEFADGQILRLLDHLKETGLDKNTIIIAMADHGEELNEHGLVGHIHNLYTQSLHVPLIIKDPTAGKRGFREKRLAGLIDLSPTILDMVSIKAPDSWQGKTLIEYLNIPSTISRTHFSQTFSPEAYADKFGIIKDNLYGIYTPEYERFLQLEAFDRDADSQQMVNRVLMPGFDGVNNLLTSISGYAQSISRDAKSGEKDSEREEMLEDLGYIMSEDETGEKKIYNAPDEKFASSVDGLLEKLSEVGVIKHETGIVKVGEELTYLAIKLELGSEDDLLNLIPIQSFFHTNIQTKRENCIFRLTIILNDKVVLDRAVAS